MDSGAIEIKAAVCREFGRPLKIERLTLAAPQGREIRVKTCHVSICHSDLTYISGGFGGSPPAVFGHEVSGAVTDIGPAAVFAGVKVGDAVMVSLLRSCGSCANCEAGTPSQCLAQYESDTVPRLADSSGSPVRAGLRVGGFAESVVVDSSQVVKLPDGMRSEIACLISCGVLTGFGAAVNTAGLQVGDAAAVVGCGGVGLSCVQGAVLAGAFPVAALDVDDERLEIACSMGANAGINVCEEGYIAKTRMLTGGRGFDAVLATVGNARAIEQSFGLLARNGVIVSVGMPPEGERVSFDATALSDNNCRILGCKVGSSRLRIDAPKLFALYRKGVLNLDEFVSSRRPLEEINESLEQARSSKHLRHVIEFPQ